jgi:hypothetical protein
MSAAEAATARPRSAAASAVAGERDLRLDFFRGLAMFIILAAHIPGNWLALWIPARFGFSDATEIFVFCSGMASAIAFGRTYDRRPWAIGTARVAWRVWQVYWAHVGMFLVIAATMAALDATGAFGRSYVAQLNLGPFFAEPAVGLVGLLTLSYVPNYFDILPMYLAILAMMPVVIVVGDRSPPALALLLAGLWLAANLQLLQFPAEPWSDREWFFNPFGWQLVFFTGFALMRGWLPPPPVSARLALAAAAIVVLAIPLAWFRLLNAVPALAEARAAIDPLIWKTDFGLLRYTHFLALAYLAWAAAGDRGARLVATGPGLGSAAWNATLKFIRKVGQQSLIVFVFSMGLARLLGVALDVAGRNLATMTLANLVGFACLVAAAHAGAWFKSEPWRGRSGPAPRP